MTSCVENKSPECRLNLKTNALFTTKRPEKFVMNIDKRGVFMKMTENFENHKSCFWFK